MSRVSAGRALLVSIAFALATAGSVSAAAARWTELGPDGGRVGEIVVDPNEPDTVYASAGAALFKSSDGGRSWRPLALPGGSAAHGLVVAPGDSSVLFVIASGGIHRSLDGGASWELASQGIPRFQERDLALDPADGRLYAVTSFSGIFFSDDRGTTWTRMEADTARRGGTLIFVHPQQPARLLTTVIGGAAPGTYLSLNRGAAWARVSPLLLDGIYFHPASPGRLFAFAARGENDNHDRVLQSLDRGETWQAIHADTTTFSYWSGMVLDSASGAPRLAATSRGLLASEDGGRTWRELAPPPNDGSPVALAGDGRTPQAIYFGSALRGVWRSDDLGASWRRSDFRLIAFSPTQLEVDPSGALYVLRGLSENSVRKSTDGGATWQELSGYSQAVGSMAIDPNNPGTLYLATGEQFRGMILWRSTNAGASWTRHGDLIPEIAGQASTQWVTQLVVDPRNSSRLFAAAFGALVSNPPERSGVHRSTDGGRTWRRVLAANDLFTVVLDPSDPNVVYAGSGANIVGDGVYRSTDGGDNWTLRNQGLADTAVQNLVLDPRNPQHLYARTLSGETYRTTNGGGSWSRFQVEGRRVLEIAFHPTRNIACVLTAGGEVLRSRDGGAVWQPIGFPGGGGLAFDRSDPRVVLATSLQGVARFPSPLWLFAAGDPARSGARFDGVAVSNSTQFTAGLDFTRFDSPAPTASPATTTSGSARVELPARRQLARLRSQLFPGDGTGSPAWIEIIGDTPVSTFFQYGSGDLLQLDGGTAAEVPYRRLVFRQVFDGPRAYRGQRAVTRLSLFNPGPAAVSVRLRYHFPGSAAVPAAAFDPVVLEVPARGSRTEPAGELFPGLLEGGWVEAETEQGRGLVGFAVVEFPDARTQLGVNAIGDAASRTLFSAQFATSPGSLFTDLNLIHTGSSPRRVTVTAVGGDGRLVAEPLVFEMQPNDSMTAAAAELFPSAGAFVGSLKVEVDGEGVVGGVVFGDPSRFRYAAAVNLQPAPLAEAVFSQVAIVPNQFFTGLAFFYPETGPGAPPAELEIEVVRADGTLAGRATRTLQPGQRISPLVEELVNAARGQAGGYVYFRSSRPLVGQMLFGALRGGAVQLFSAVPPSAL